MIKDVNSSNARNYRPRLLDQKLKDTLKYAPAVVIEGPRGCGKTTTGIQAASSFLAVDEVELADPSSGAMRGLLGQEPPLLVDEWQGAPGMWKAVRRECDRRGGKHGQFILTGSSTLPDNSIRHSGAGRLAPLRLRTFSSYESGISNGSVSLGSMLRGESVDAAADLVLTRIALAEGICRG
ncbi:MAG: AAA family ATPase, partial [bacterium]|nr:AAA family ATPase [bacterium]